VNPYIGDSNMRTQNMDYSEERRPDEKSDSIPEMENRFRSSGKRESGIVYMNLYPN